MKALLLKDFYVMKKYMRLFLLMMLLFLVFAAIGDKTGFLNVYTVFLASAVSVSMLSYDDKFAWSSYSQTMPFTRSQMVSEKYLLTLIMSGTAILLTLLVKLPGAVRSGMSGGEFGELAAALVCLGVVGPSLMLPVTFKYGMEKGRIAYLIIFGVMLVALVVLSDEENASLSLQTGAFMSAAAAGALILFALSWLLSIRLYQRREL